MIRALPVLAAAFLVLGYACGGNSKQTTPSPTPIAAPTSPTAAADVCTPARTHAAGTGSEALDLNGMSRAYVLHVPPAYSGATPLPLVLAFHPYGADARAMLDYTGAGQLADRQNLIVVAPESAGTPVSWNTKKDANGPQDVAFVQALLQKLKTELCIDAGKTYAMGYDEGGAMAMLAACESPDQIAAVGAVATTYVQCAADVPLVAFHGMADAAIAFEGGPNRPELGGGNSPPVRRTISEWARALGCDALPLISRPSSEVELSTFNRCLIADGDVLLYSIIGGGHTWPGATVDPPADVASGMTTAQLNATQTMWDFFAAHPLAH